MGRATGLFAAGRAMGLARGFLAEECAVGLAIGFLVARRARGLFFVAAWVAAFVRGFFAAGRERGLATGRFITGWERGPGEDFFEASREVATFPLPALGLATFPLLPDEWIVCFAMGWATGLLGGCFARGFFAARRFPAGPTRGLLSGFFEATLAIPALGLVTDFA